MPRHTSRFALFLAAGLIALTLGGCGRGSDDQVHDFFSDIDKGARTEAAARFSPELRLRFSQDALLVALDHWSSDMASHGGLKDIAVSGGVITYNQLAMYDVVLTYGDGKTKALKTTLVYDEKGWYINTAL
tara:strand:+ start:3942 stop:4334 length:393 start_codon:yes stop_codon:yes gene_type:complete